jgi:MFS family permease
MLGLTQDYIVPFALALKATAVQIGLLTSIPNASMALSQLAAPRLAEKAGNRKGLIVPVVFLHALMWLPILLVPYLSLTHKAWWLIGFLTVSTVFSSLGNPAWGSLMADLVPEEVRGRYFSFRGRICGLVTLAFFFIGGAILHFFAANLFLGFFFLFSAAMLFRLVSCHLLSKMHEPPLSDHRKERSSLLHVVRNMGWSNLGRFMMLVSLMNFATNVAGPFFAVYMLRDLKFNYLTYVTVIGVATMANLIFLTFWGKRADRAGNISVLKVTSVLVPLVPLLWIGSHQLHYLIPVQILSGFAWAGFNLASANFLYDASAPEKRTQYIAVFNALNGCAVCLGALLGGYLASWLPPLRGYSLLTLFLVSGALRGVVAIHLLRHVSEVRKVPRIGAAEFLFGRPNFRRIGVSNSLQPAPQPLSEFNAKKLGAAFSLHPAWWHELAAPSRDPPS